MKTILFFLLPLFLINPLIFGQLEQGNPVPPFTAPDENGKPWSFPGDLKTDYLVVYFYPAAFTGGCTAQACSYRDHMEELSALGVTVVGVSGDKPENLARFREVHGLNFPLLSDEHGELARRFGVSTREGGTIEREIGGATIRLSRGITTSRWTFVIGPDHRVLYLNNQVKAAEDSQEVLEIIRKQKGS